VIDTQAALTITSRKQLDNRLRKVWRVNTSSANSTNSPDTPSFTPNNTQSEATISLVENDYDDLLSFQSPTKCNQLQGSDPSGATSSPLTLPSTLLSSSFIDSGKRKACLSFDMNDKPAPLARSESEYTILFQCILPFTFECVLCQAREHWLMHRN
jgi:hypothetical protein